MAEKNSVPQFCGQMARFHGLWVRGGCIVELCWIAKEF